MKTEFDVQAVDLTAVLNQPAEDKAKQLPDPATFHLLCRLLTVSGKYDSGLIKSDKTVQFEELLNP